MNCDRCGTENISGTAYCVTCGAAMNTPVPELPVQKKKNIRMPIFLAVGITAVILAALLIWLLLLR